MILNGFNIAAEEVMFLIAISILYLTVVSRPRQTAVFSVVFYGQIISVVNILLHVGCIYFINISTSIQGVIFRIIVMFYYVTYLGILTHLFSYIHLLSLKQRENMDILNITNIIFASVYAVVVGAVYLSDSYVEIVDAEYRFTSLFNVNIYMALIEIALVSSSIIINRRGIPKIFMKYIGLFVPLEIVLLIVQVFNPRYVFLSVTYVLPFILCYIIFHSILFDEVTGCQNKMAFQSHFQTLRNKNKSFKVICIKFPRLEIVDNIELMDIVKRRLSTEIRSMEERNNKSYAYQINDYTIAIILEHKSDALNRQTTTFLKRRLDEAMMNWEFSNRPEYNMIVIDDADSIKNVDALDTYLGFLFEHEALKKSNCYEATAQDYARYKERRHIEKCIVDIRNQDDLNDKRVIVFVQPIYDVANNDYRNAEALMRLDVDGKIVQPDVFIPLAEKVGCVHTLTRIILNKVCKKIYEIQDYYNFEAVSVNVSLSEFMDYDLHDELIEIIQTNGISCSKIRLEMTETMTNDEIEAIAHNMQEFNAAGIHFYLDDFGTGYSNLERIVSLPFKTIKFDKTLLYKSEDDPILMQLIKNMVEVFKNHGMVVLVEGVENQKQEELSIKLGFEYIQGYRFAKPIPVGNVESYFEKKSKKFA